jgi:dUTP pyrophosphatase
VPGGNFISRQVFFITFFLCYDIPMQMTLKIKKVHPDAVLPRYATVGDAGMDVYACETVTIPPGKAVQVRSGLVMEIPDGYVGLFWDKSGLSMKHSIKSLGGVLDSGYRGEILMGVINLGTEPYTFEKGHKVLQMLVQKIERVDIVETEDLSDTVRGGGGFGSTGK